LSRRVEELLHAAANPAGGVAGSAWPTPTVDAAIAVLTAHPRPNLAIVTPRSLAIIG